MSATLQEVPAMLCTVEDAAKRLCVSTTTVRAWFHEGKLRGFQAGRVLRIDTSSIAEALRRGALPVGTRKIGRGAR